MSISPFLRAVPYHAKVNPEQERLVSGLLDTAIRDYRDSEDARKVFIMNVLDQVVKKTINPRQAFYIFRAHDRHFNFHSCDDCYRKWEINGGKGASRIVAEIAGRYRYRAKEISNVVNKYLKPKPSSRGGAHFSSHGARTPHHGSRSYSRPQQTHYYGPASSASADDRVDQRPGESVDDWVARITPPATQVNYARGGAAGSSSVHDNSFINMDVLKHRIDHIYHREPHVAHDLAKEIFDIAMDAIINGNSESLNNLARLGIDITDTQRYSDFSQKITLVRNSLINVINQNNGQSVLARTLLHWLNKTYPPAI